MGSRCTDGVVVELLGVGFANVVQTGFVGEMGAGSTGTGSVGTAFADVVGPGLMGETGVGSTGTGSAAPRSRTRCEQGRPLRCRGCG